MHGLINNEKLHIISTQEKQLIGKVNTFWLAPIIEYNGFSELSRDWKVASDVAELGQEWNKGFCVNRTM